MPTPATSPKPSSTRTVTVPDIEENASDPSTYAPLDIGMEMSSRRLPRKRWATAFCPTSIPTEKVTPNTSVPAMSRRTTWGSSGAMALVT